MEYIAGSSCRFSMWIARLLRGGAGLLRRLWKYGFSIGGAMGLVVGAVGL